jgi:hypothetical protein
LFVWNGCKIVDLDSHRRCSNDAEASYGKASTGMQASSTVLADSKASRRTKKSNPTEIKNQVLSWIESG